jgi:hypothetical protein
MKHEPGNPREVDVNRTMGRWPLYLTATLIASAAIVVPPALRSTGTGTPAAPSPADVDLLSRADQLLIRDCMRGKEFDYSPIPPDRIDPPLRYPYVVTDVAWANTEGLRPYAGSGTGEADANQRYVDGLAADRQAAYSDALVGPRDGPAVSTEVPSGGVLGHSAQGCQAAAATSLYGDFPAWFTVSSIADDLPRLWRAQVTGDQRFAAAVAAWAGCMHAAGLDYASPAQAAASFRRTAPGRPGPQEVRVAVAEVGCAASSGLGTVAARLDAEYAATVRQQHHLALTRLWRLQQHALPAARGIVAWQAAA